ncbi:hypothetical protein EDB87DRAFT_1580840 [Lactarius vividus]|nr:hypothetical protein EDB87DRAFT_1580840 [Lactarius vividus]
MLLFKAPPSHYFLGYYGIVYHQDAWHITHNVHSVQGASPGVPLQPETTPLLDHSLGETLAPLYPNGDGLRPMKYPSRPDRELHNANGFCTTRRQDHDSHPNQLGDNLVPTKQLVVARIWALEAPDSHPRRDETRAGNPITVARLMKLVGTSVDTFFREEVKVVGVIHVSAGSWMPIIQLTRHVI